MLSALLALLCCCPLAAQVAESYALGRFVVTIAAQPLSVEIRRANSTAVIWSTIPGQPFLSVAAGAFDAEEKNGFFEFTGASERRTEAQTLDVVEDSEAPPSPDSRPGGGEQQPGQEEASLTLHGSLSGGGGPSTAYAFALSTAADGSDAQVFFRATVEEQPGERRRRVYLTFRSSADESFWGFGTAYTVTNHKGRVVPVILTEQGIGRGVQPLTALLNIAAPVVGAVAGDWATTYSGVPSYLSHDPQGGWRGLILANYQYSEFDLRAAGSTEVMVATSRGDDVGGDVVELAAVEGWLIDDGGRGPLAVVEETTRRTGRMKALPRWLAGSGAVVGAEGGTEEVCAIFDRMVDAGVPIGSMWLQDWSGVRLDGTATRLWWNWEVDEAYYPDWSAMVAHFRERANSTVMTYINPYLASDVEENKETPFKRNMFEEAEALGFLVMREATTNGAAAGGAEAGGGSGGGLLEVYRQNSGGLPFGTVDLSNPAAVAWLQDVMRTEMLGNAGSVGWMADFAEYLPFDAVLHSGEPASAVHTRFSEMWAETNRFVKDEAEQNPSVGHEVSFFTRSRSRRSPEHSTLFWLGDQMTSWDEFDGMESAVLGLLSGGLNGATLQHSDIGGYTMISYLPIFPGLTFLRDAELLARWGELSAFADVVFRTHAGTNPEESVQPWTDRDTLAHFATFASVHAALWPYRSDLMAEAEARGVPLARYMWLQYPSDLAVREMASSQFMLGPDLLVAPVLRPGVDGVRAYLPAEPQGWVYLWAPPAARYSSSSSSPPSVASAAGEWVDAEAPIGRPAVWVRAVAAQDARLAPIFELVQSLL